MHVPGAGDHELLRRAHLLVAQDIAAQVQSHLAPVPDREHRYPDVLEPPEWRALAPPVVVQSVLGDRADEVEPHRGAPALARRAMLVVGAQRRVPVRTVAAENPAVVVRAAVLVDEPVIRRDAGKPRRIERRHQPLRHGVVGLPDATDAAVAPGLPRDPGDQLDIILLLGAVHEAELALGLSGAAHVGMHIGVALFDVPFDRPGLAPEEQRVGRHRVELELIRRACKQRGAGTFAIRAIDT